MEDLKKEISEAARILSNTNRAVAFCGSGVSEESGISTFRDPGGLWDQIDPIEVGTTEGLIQAMEKNSDRLKPIFKEILCSFEKADPNPAHKVLAELEKKEIISAIITQNIDNLHQESGSKNVIEVHGNLFRMKCLSCGKLRKYNRKELVKKTLENFRNLTEFDLRSLLSLAVKCDFCQNITRPDVVMFGEAVQNLNDSIFVSRSCEVMLILGTSGLVYPAAGFPMEAKKAGAKIIEMNPTENAFSKITDIYIPMKAGEGLLNIASVIGLVIG
ncbi:NAD-dependent protein deacylase [bacterium]|nr:NAD-dependent protein deacylase [bacterium]